MGVRDQLVEVGPELPVLPILAQLRPRGPRDAGAHGPSHHVVPSGEVEEVTIDDHLRVDVRAAGPGARGGIALGVAGGAEGDAGGAEVDDRERGSAGAHERHPP